MIFKSPTQTPTSPGTPGSPGSSAPSEQPARLLAAYTAATELPNPPEVPETDQVMTAETSLVTPCKKSTALPLAPKAPPMAGFNALLAHLYRQAA